MASDILERRPPEPGIRLRYGADRNQFGELRLPVASAKHPVAMVVHGGYWRAQYDLSYSGHMARALTQAGLATWNVEYRRVGNQGGGWPGTFDDVTAGLRFLSQIGGKYNLDAQRVVAVGHSAGAQLAFCLAGHKLGVHGVVSLAGVLDLRRAWELHLSNDAVVEFLGGTPSEVAEHYRDASPAELAISGTVRQRIVHGLRDDAVPYSISPDYVKAKRAKGEDVDLLTLASADHFDIVDPQSEVWPQVEKVIVGCV
ncbi:MAG: prolyl oligopeptidase family serine peptidase [Acidobacteria bacterium]|nr:prolyl oligopeptidase family serine peptidase [Acidobacteriota bacterium]